MSTEREHVHDHKRDDDHLHHDDRAVGRRNQSAMLQAPEHPVASGLVARKARDANGVADGADAAVGRAASSSGQSLPAELQRKFESSLGADLSDVRVHTGADSAEANDAVGAKAYATGQDIHFADGQYDPASQDGQTLLAHEVAHTVQQKGGGTKRQHKLAVSSPHDAAESEADAAASAMVSGQTFSIAGVARSALFRSPDLPSPGVASLAQTARKGVLEAQAAAVAAIQRVAVWTLKQCIKFVTISAESPSVVWQPSLMRQGLGLVVGAGIGKASSAASAAAKDIPGAGVLVGMGIDLIGAGLKDIAKEKIEGGKELGPEEAGAASRKAAGDTLLPQLDVISTNAIAITEQMKSRYSDALDRVASPDVNADDAGSLIAWSAADIAASLAIAPSGDGLYQQMLLGWVGEHALDGTGRPTSGTNRTSFTDACKVLFGTGNIANYWALQIRQDLVEMGLPTTQADAKLNGSDGGHGGEMFFESAVDLDALARAFVQKENTPEFLHIAQGGQFQVHLVYTLMTEPGDALLGPGYTHMFSGGYTLATQGLQGGDQVLNHKSSHADSTRTA